MKTLTILSLLLCTVVTFADQSNLAETDFVFYGTSDASAAVALTEDMFIMADDENNTLRVYKTNNNSLPVASFDLTKFLGTLSSYPEADIEGATMIGDHIYWISSHGRNKEGKIRPNRYRFFATCVDIQDPNFILEPVGTPSHTLIGRLVKDKEMIALGLDRATGFTAKLKKEQRKKLAPKVDGLNIEALCASHDGNSIYIGFRNPLPYDQTKTTPMALVVPLNNYRQVIHKQQEPVFGDPILWNLKGLGIRSMEYSSFHKVYFVIAGAHNSQSKFALYRWSGKKSDQPVSICKIETEKNQFTPEALIVFKNCGKLLLLSDDGTLITDVSNINECMEGEMLENGKCPNKYLTNPNRKSFRGIWSSQ